MIQNTLPKKFIDRMSDRLKDDAPAFLEAMSEASVSAFHCNIFCASTEDLIPYLNTFSVSPISGISNGFYYDSPHIGRSALHHAGLLYSQDPSAMLPALCARIFDGIRILDLCAAPGGKTSQLAIASSSHRSILVANEPHPARNRILRQNIERMGYRNIIVTQADPEELAGFFPESFDLILVDAPCSGEGMFRKYPESIPEWSEKNISHCVLRQKNILDAAFTLLAPGGQLIYSTCTYAPEEDELQVKYLIDQFDFKPLPIPEVLCGLSSECDFGSRICYPHLHKGEGQFFASLQKSGIRSESTSQDHFAITPATGRIYQAALEILSPTVDLTGLYIIERQKQLYILPAGLPRLPERAVTSYGVILGGMDKQGKRFLPHHQFFSAYPECFSLSLSLSPDSEELAAYLKGMELSETSALSADPHSKGYGVIRTFNAGIGGFRYSGGRLKNLYPKGLRNP